MITLKDVARECEVSFSTVSKALRGSSEISRETMLMVRDKAREMGYHPNLAAQTLRTNRTYDIGIIFEDLTGSGLRHQYFATIFGSIQAAAMAKGYDITFMSAMSDYAFNYFEHCQYRNFDGVAILSTNFARDDIQSLIMSDIPTVTLDYALDNEHYAVMNDNRTGIKTLVEYIISRGHTRVAFIHGEDTFVTRERIASFIDVLESHNIKVENRYLVGASYHSPIKSGEAAAELIKMRRPPTCILFPDDFSALGGIHALNDNGFVIGRDISVAGYDGIMLTSLLVPPLTTYRQPSDKIGTLLVQCLVEQIDRKAQAAGKTDAEGQEEGEDTKTCGTDDTQTDGLSRHKEVLGEFVQGASVAAV